MAITTITNSMVSVNAIQGTLIADNAITAVHIATNAVSGTLIADNAVTATHIAQNTITVTQLADDAVEADKIADGVITTNHLNKAMISSQTEVTPVAGDFVLLGDTSDSNNLKKAPLTLLLNSNVDISGKLNLSGGTMTGDLTVQADGAEIFLKSADYNIARIIPRGTGGDLDKGLLSLFDAGTEDVRIDTAGNSWFNGGNVGIGTTSPSDYNFGDLAITNGTSAGITLVSATNSIGTLAFADGTSGNTAYRGFVQYSHITDNLVLGTSGTTKMTLQGTGNLGIGTTTPQSKLQVATSNGTMSHFGGIGVTDTHYSGISLGYTEASNANYRKAAIVQEQIGDGAARGHMHFLVDTANDGNSAVLADSKIKIHGTSGNVGINCAASNAKLEVVATSGEVFRADANSGAFRLVANQTDVQASLMRVTAGAVSAPSYSFIGDTTTGMSRPTGSAINFVCGGTEKARVDTNGLKITHTSHTGESAGQPDVVKTSFGGIHFESGSSGTSRGITWEASDGNTQAGIVCHNNGSDGTHLGFFTTYTYAGGPICNMKLTNYGTVVAGASTDVMSVTPASTSAFHSNYGDILCNASNNDIILSDLLPGYSRNAYATIKSTGSYMYFSVNGAYSHYLGSSGGLTASDARLKENVSTLTNSLSKVKQLRGVNFTWKDTETRGSENNIGFIAQEVETIYPELVGDGGLPKDENGEDAMKAVNYEKLVPVLVEAIKELEARLAAVEG